MLGVLVTSFGAWGAVTGRSPIALQLPGPFLDRNAISLGIWTSPDLASLFCGDRSPQLDDSGGTEGDLLVRCSAVQLVEIKHCRSSCPK